MKTKMDDLDLIAEHTKMINSLLDLILQLDNRVKKLEQEKYDRSTE